nr:type III-A CRISPR-associated protein Csm2 [uncultured Selenomonas sp.]
MKPFVEAAKLNKWIDGIGTDIRAYEDFAHYVEALVAYHKFYGGRD